MGSLWKIEISFLVGSCVAEDGRLYNDLNKSSEAPTGSNGWEALLVDAPRLISRSGSDGSLNFCNENKISRSGGCQKIIGDARVYTNLPLH